MNENPKWSLSDDHTKATVEFPTQPLIQYHMDADGIDEFIAMLGQVRMDMLPVPSASDPDPGSRLQSFKGARWYLAPQSDGTLLSAIFHPGYRWVATLVKPEHIERFIQIAQSAAASEGDGNQHSPQT
jgi:hypothetical protein